MAEIFERVEFVDQDESVQVVADNIRDTGEVPERYVRSETKADPVIIDTEGYNLPVIDMSRLLNPDFSEEETAKLGSACKHWGFFQVCLVAEISTACLPTFISLTITLSVCTIQLPCIYSSDDYFTCLVKRDPLSCSIIPWLTLITINSWD